MDRPTLGWARFQRSLAAVIGGVEIEDEEERGAEGARPTTPGRSADTSPTSVIGWVEIRDEEERGRALLGPTRKITQRRPPRFGVVAPADRS